MDKNLIPGSKIASSFETSAPFNIETAKINKAYLIKFLIVIALLTSQFGKDWLFHESFCFTVHADNPASAPTMHGLTRNCLFCTVAAQREAELCQLFYGEDYFAATAHETESWMQECEASDGNLVVWSRCLLCCSNSPPPLNWLAAQLRLQYHAKVVFLSYPASHSHSCSLSLHVAKRPRKVL